MEQISQNINGAIVTLKSVQRNKVYKCKSCDDDITFCDYKKELSLTRSPGTLTLTELVFNLKNKSENIWCVTNCEWRLIDTDGYAHVAKPICFDLRPRYHPRTIEIADQPGYVAPGTQVDFVLLSAELEQGKDIATVICMVSNASYHFIINPLDAAAQQALKSDEPSNVEDREVSWQMRQLTASQDKLDELIFMRLNNVLSQKEAVALENSVRTQVFQVRKRIELLPEEKKRQVQAQLTQTLSQYEAQLIQIKAGEQERIKLDQKIDRLSDLSGREFEEYISGLLKALGYEDVKLTPLSNDKGVDIIARYQGDQLAIQCKRYKGLVGSPEILNFLGALKHSGIEKGMFVTTGQFSIEAEKLAMQHSIELVDNFALGRLVESALTASRFLPKIS